MWQLFLIFIGSVVCSDYGTDVEKRVGEDVNLQCPGTSKNDPIISIGWSLSDGTPYFFCDKDIPCNVNSTNHSLGVEGDTFISILTIRNVSLIHEDEYSFSMVSTGYLKSCRINLTIHVPPTGLVLSDKHHDHGSEVLQNNGILIVGEGENKSIVCKTNTSVKPAVDLKWTIPKELLVINEYVQQIQDVRDERLSVPTRILSFTPNYTFDKDLPLVCKVVTSSSFEQIQTSIHIRKKGTEVSDTSMTTVLTSPPGGMNQKIWIITAGGSSGVILLLVLTIVGGIFRSKKMTDRGRVKAESTRDSTQSRPSQARGALPTPPARQSSLTTNLLGRQSSPTRSFRPAPPVPLADIPMRQMVPVSDDTTGTTSENNRLRKATSRGASASSPATHSERGLDTDMKYDVLNDMEYDVLNMEYAVVNKTPSKATGAVPHVYRETTDGLAEYALVSRPKMGKNALQPRFRSTEQLDAEFEYAVVDKSHRTGRESVPHVYAQTMSGLEEYAVVNKPKDRKKCQSEVRHTTASGDFEAEYAVVDKWKKN